MGITHFISFWSPSICQWSGKVKSHKKIAWELEVLEIFKELKCECWYVLYLFSASYVNQIWANSKTHKLNKHAEQPLWCAKGENSTEKLKNLNMTQKMIFSCRIMKKQVSIDCEMYFMRFKRKCVNAIWDGCIGLMEFDERKVLKFWEKKLWVEKTS